MGLVTRFFIIEPSDRPAEPGDVAALLALTEDLYEWLPEHLLGHNYNPKAPELIASPDTMAEIATDPELYLHVAIVAAKGDAGFYKPDTATIAFPVGELMTGLFYARGDLTNTAHAICGDAILHAIRGWPPPPGTPGPWWNNWPMAAWGVTLHEMIHT